MAAARSRPPRVREGAIALGLLYAGWLAIEMVRGAQAGVYGTINNAVLTSATVFLLVGFAATAVGGAADRREREERLSALALAPAIYVTLNVLMHFAGVVAPATLDASSTSIAFGDPADLLGFLGIGVGRVQFPLANSINLFGVAAGGGLAAAGVMLVRRSPCVPRSVVAVLAAGSLAGLLLGDSRGSLLTALAVIAWFGLSKRIRAASGVAVLLPVLPVLLLGILGVLAGTGLDTALSRGGNGDFATGTNRLYIWEGAWNVVKHPSIDAIWGWGAGGHITSGASVNYAYLFTSLPDPTRVPAHSLVLQTLLDGGYLGLLILVGAMAMAITSLARFTRLEPTSGTGPLLASAITILLGGTTEVAPTIYAQEALIATLLAVGAAAAIAVRVPVAAPQRERAAPAPPLAWGAERAPG